MYDKAKYFILPYVRGEVSMLVFGIHCHQPIGNFDYVFEEAYERLINLL
jgi:hypothetical protein